MEWKEAHWQVDQRGAAQNTMHRLVDRIRMVEPGERASSVERPSPRTRSAALAGPSLRHGDWRLRHRSVAARHAPRLCRPSHRQPPSAGPNEIDLDGHFGCTRGRRARALAHGPPPRICKGQDGLTLFVEDVLGYSATGAVNEEKFFAVHGPGGNGKGVLFGTAKAILGDYAVHVPGKALVEGDALSCARGRDRPSRREAAAARHGDPVKRHMECGSPQGDDRQRR